MPIKSRWSVSIPDVSLPGLIFNSPTHPQPNTKKCYIDTTRPETHNFTAHEYFTLCKRFAAGLQKSGLKPGDRVLVFSPNNLFYPVAFMGVVMSGCIFTGANPTYTSRELAYQLNDSGATYLLCADAALDTGLEAAEQIGMGRDRIFVFNDLMFEGKGQGLKGCRYWGELFGSKEDGDRFAWEELTTPEAASKTLALNYSSGTTGVPKGVEISHKNYVANTLQYSHAASLDPGFEEKIAKAKWLCFLPMYHAMAQNIFIAGALKHEVPVYMMPRFDFIQMLENIQKYRITTMKLVPPIAVLLATHPVVKNYDLSSVESVGCGAAPLGLEVSAKIEELFPKGHLYVRQGWGMTEATCSILGWDPAREGTSASVGELNPNCEAMVMASDGVTELGKNQRGEIWVRGPNIMKGYWKKAAATQETLTPDGWLKTGDIGYVDDTGYFHIVDRIKELIKVKGNQVAPAELESILYGHPAVADAAVIGITKDHEEYPRAYIVLNPGSPATLETANNIVEYMKAKVAPVKRITGGVVFVDTIPKNPSGKILRKILREQAQKDIKAGLAASKL